MTFMQQDEATNHGAGLDPPQSSNNSLTRPSESPKTRSFCCRACCFGVRDPASASDMDQNKTSTITQPTQSLTGTMLAESTTSRQYQEGDTIKPEAAIFRFLDLPAELRRIVYSYIVPDMTHKHCLRRPYSDGQDQCCYSIYVTYSPALLQTNRRIYDELLPKWYSSTRYYAVLDFSSKHCLTRKPTLAVVDLPFGFQFITELDITVFMTSFWQRKTPTGTMRKLVECLSVGGPGHLRYLKIYLYYNTITFVQDVDSWKSSTAGLDYKRADLEFVCSFLRTLRSERVDVIYSPAGPIGKHGPHYVMTTHDDLAMCDPVLGLPIFNEMRERMRLLEEEISGH